MKTFLLLFLTITLSLSLYGESLTCGNVLNDTFDDAGAIPSEWTEYSTVGSVSVVNGYMKLNLNSNTPSVFRTFTPVTNNNSCSFDIQGSRTTMNCQLDLMSSDGKYIASIALGKATTDIKYSTGMVNSIPGTYIAGVIGDAKFAKNSFYSLTMYVDFDNQTVDFYNAGELTLEDVPFLEATNDFAKVNIQLLYMYANTGTAFFDNFSIMETDEDRIHLINAVSSAQMLLDGASVGNGFQQCDQTNVDAFQLAIENAVAIENDCDALAATITTANSDLESAQADFLASKNNPVVLKFYSEYNFSGDETKMYCGYYNGGLGDLEDTPVSFKLDSGYMATFAQDVDGLGFSKVYIAQDSDLEINLPEDLQRSISFIRVSPWYPVSKKGSLGDVKWSSSEKYNTSWYYNWGFGDNSSEYTIPEVQFVPMSWSKGDNYTALEKMEVLGQNMALNHHMAFNEPDNKDQSNLTVADALEAYPKLLASGLRLGAPGVENIQYSANNDSFNTGSWIQEFMDSCIARGYRVDFIPAHDYVRHASVFLERFEGLYNRYKIPVWVTEYNHGNPNMGSSDLTVDQGYANIKKITEDLEGADFIERYNWYYFFGASSGIGGISDGELNITGQFYRDLESQYPSYTQEVYEEGDSIGPAPISGFYDTEEGIVNISLYPNPVTGGVLKIAYSDISISSAATVCIYDINGKEVLSHSNSPQSINVSHLENGFYIVKVESVNSELIQKIIINQ